VTDAPYVQNQTQTENVLQSRLVERAWLRHQMRLASETGYFQEFVRIQSIKNTVLRLIYLERDECNYTTMRDDGSLQQKRKK
jgi:hypothetical protein